MYNNSFTLGCVISINSFSKYVYIKYFKNFVLVMKFMLIYITKDNEKDMRSEIQYTLYT